MGRPRKNTQPLGNTLNYSNVTSITLDITQEEKSMADALRDNGISVSEICRGTIRNAFYTQLPPTSTTYIPELSDKVQKEYRLVCNLMDNVNLDLNTLLEEKIHELFVDAIQHTYEKLSK